MAEERIEELLSLLREEYGGKTERRDPIANDETQNLCSDLIVIGRTKEEDKRRVLISKWQDRKDKMDLSNIHFGGADFSNSNLEWSDFRDCKLVFANFEKANASFCLFINCWIVHANFRCSNISGSGFKGSFIFFANFENTIITQSGFQLCDLKDSNFENAIIEESNFLHARNHKEILKKANIKSMVVLLDNANTIDAYLGKNHNSS
jgi:uncharacterized protein YjbI with pentapeptide repeats